MTGVADGHGAPSRADVVIVGGGIVGCAVAYFLAGRPDFDATVCVLERDPTYATASTTLSASSLRLQFSTPENVAMSEYSVTFLREARARFAVDGIDAPLAITSRPYLTLAGDQGADALAGNSARLRDQGVPVRTLTREQVSREWPWMAVDDVALAALGPDDEGVFDGALLHDALRRAALARGVRVVVQEAIALHRSGDRVEAVETADGSTIGCDAVVNAAGPHARTVATMAGVDLPVSPRKRCMFAFDSRETLAPCPIVVDEVGGIAFRPEGPGYLTTLSRLPDGRDEETMSLAVEPDLFDDHIWPALVNRVPVFDRVRRTSGWAGLYEVNTHDHNAIIGRHPEVANLFLCNGFSGHGLQHAPAAGRAVAELIATGGYQTLDLSALGFDRLRGVTSGDETRVI